VAYCHRSSPLFPTIPFPSYVTALSFVRHPISFNVASSLYYFSWAKCPLLLRDCRYFLNTINSGIGTPRPSPRDRSANPRRRTNSAAILLVLSTTVMGPAQNSAHDQSPSRGSEAPTLFPGQDLYIWRKAVAEWVDLVHTAATQSEDRHFKKVNATLGRQLYRALPSSHRSIVDEAQARGIVVFGSHRARR
jgi:hypothetical protein